ncbi:MAG: hypothetical protein WC284_16800 [Candidimonas sp.]
MAKIVEDYVIFRLNRLVRDNSDDSSAITPEDLNDLVQLVTKAVEEIDPKIVVELAELGDDK